MPASPFRRAAQPSFSIGGANFLKTPAKITPIVSIVSAK